MLALIARRVAAGEVGAHMRSLSVVDQKLRDSPGRHVGGGASVALSFDKVVDRCHVNVLQFGFATAAAGRAVAARSRLGSHIWSRVHREISQ
jgi:hypothetical protein